MVRPTSRLLKVRGPSPSNRSFRRLLSRRTFASAVRASGGMSVVSGRRFNSPQSRRDFFATSREGGYSREWSGATFRDKSRIRRDTDSSTSKQFSDFFLPTDTVLGAHSHFHVSVTVWAQIRLANKVNSSARALDPRFSRLASPKRSWDDVPGRRSTFR